MRSFVFGLLGLAKRKDVIDEDRTHEHLRTTLNTFDTKTIGFELILTNAGVGAFSDLQPCARSCGGISSMDDMHFPF